MNRWLERIVAALRRFRRSRTPPPDRFAATLAPPTSGEAESFQAWESPASAQDVASVRTPQVAPCVEVEDAPSTPSIDEERASGLQEKAESSATESRTPAIARLMPEDHAAPSLTDAAKRSDDELVSSEPDPSDEKPSPQHLMSAHAEMKRLGDDEIASHERGEVPPPHGRTPAAVSAPLTQQPSLSQLHCEDPDPILSSRTAIPDQKISDTRDIDAVEIDAIEQAIATDEGVLEPEAPLTVTSGEEQWPQTGDSAAPATPFRRKATRVAPEKRGGRPRGSRTSDGAEPAEVFEASKRSAHTRQQRPELVWWRQGMSLVVGVEVPEELGSLKARQSPDVALEEDSRNGCWRLKHPLESVEFVATESDEIPAVEIVAERYRIFNVVGKDGGRGRAVRQGSAGRFIAVVPASWRWNEDLSGPVTNTAESVAGACCAHYVELPLEPGRTLAFDNAEGICVHIPCAGQQFELVGAHVDDASVDAGPLFVQEPPQLRGAAGVANVSAVVVGEEGFIDGKRGWRGRADRFEDLRAVIADRRAGWFFVRLYDGDDELIESLDFRFVADLDAIEVEPVPPLPGLEGHTTAQIRFRHGRECSVRTGSLNPLAIELLPDGSGAIVPSDGESDETHWLIGPDSGPQVEVTVLVKRMWWARAIEGQEPARFQWTDRAVTLSRQDFKPTSATAITLRLPRAGWADEVQIGFEGSPSRSVHLRASDRECIVPLRELGDSREIEAQSAASLTVWLTPRGRAAERLHGVVGFLAAEASDFAVDDGFLHSLKHLKPCGMMAVLTRVQSACHVPLRHMIRDLRTVSYERIPKHRRGIASETFVKEALCILAMAVEQFEGLKTNRIEIQSRWARRASAAQVHFPEVMSVVRSRYRRIEERSATKYTSRTHLRADR